MMHRFPWFMHDGPTSVELLKGLDKKVTDAIGKKVDVDDYTAKVKELTESNTALEARVKACDDTIVTQKETIERVEAEFKTHRFGRNANGEGDTLRNFVCNLGNGEGDDEGLLPTEVAPLKSWLPRIEQLSEGSPILNSRGMPIDSRLRGAAKMAQSDPEKYAACGGWFQARIKAYILNAKGRPVEAEKWNKRADQIMAALGGVSAQSKAALQEDTAGEGQELVPTITEAMIGWLMKEASVVRAAGPTMITMTAKQHDLPNLQDDFTVTVDNEEAVIADSETAGTPFGESALIARRFNGLVTISIELIQDNIIALMDFLMTHLTQQLGRKQDALATEGDGTPPNWSGIATIAGTNSINNDAKAANAGVPVTVASWLKMMYGAEHWSTVESGVVFSHPWVIRDLVAAIIAAASEAQSMLFGITTPTPGSVGGRRVYPTSTILRNRSAGTDESFAYHGDPQYLVMGDRMGITFDVNPFAGTEFKKGQILLRLIQRTGFVVWVPGYWTKLLNIETIA